MIAQIISHLLAIAVRDRLAAFMAQTLLSCQMRIVADAAPVMAVLSGVPVAQLGKLCVEMARMPRAVIASIW